MSLRLLPVPDGCNGDRVDAALARMTGLSRSRVGELCEAPELKVELRVDAERVEETLAAIRAVHPYETPEIFVIPLLL